MPWLSEAMKDVISCDRETAGTPLADDGIVFGVQMFQEGEGTMGEAFVAFVCAVGKKERTEGVDYQQVLRGVGECLPTAGRRRAEGVVRVPIVRRADSEDAAHGVERVGLEQARQEGGLVAEQPGHLGDAHMGEVAGARTKQAPRGRFHAAEVELPGQVDVFLLKAFVVGVAHVFLQQTGLSEEKGLYLEHRRVSR